MKESEEDREGVNGGKSEVIETTGLGLGGQCFRDGVQRVGGSLRETEEARR